MEAGKEAENCISEIISLLEKDNGQELRACSNKWIIEAATINDRKLANASLMAYSLHKHMGKEHVRSDRKSVV